MASTQAHRFPRVGRHSMRSALYGTKYRPRPKEGCKRILPGIGTYTIDSPKDKNSTVRQQCLRYQEAHRGILRARIDSLPDIPKRYGMKSVPIVQLKDTHDMMTSPINFDLDTPSPEVRTEQSDYRQRKMEKLYQLRRQDSAVKLLTQEELVSRSPIGRMVQDSLNRKQSLPIAGFGVRKSKTSGPPAFHKEYTNLSVNVEFSEPGQAPSRATDRELVSQAEYRRQLTFYLSQMSDDGKISNVRDDDNDDSRSDMDTCRSLIINIPANKVGHTSKYNVWASNLRLKEVLADNSTPDIKRKLACSRSREREPVKSVSRLRYTVNTRGRGRCRFDNDDDYDDDDENDDKDSDEAWLHVVNTPVIDNDIYDRYANVKLPPSRLQSRCRVTK